MRGIRRVLEFPDCRLLGGPELTPPVAMSRSRPAAIRPLSFATLAAPARREAGG